MKTIQVVIGSIILYSIFMFLFPYILLQLSIQYSIPKLFIPNIYVMFLGLSLMAISFMNFVNGMNVLVSKGKNTNPLITQPPKEFVATGLFKYVRNPIYLGHLFFFFGEFLLFGDVLQLAYTVFIFVCLHSFIIFYEEPMLYKQFGDTYKTYIKKVKRWGLF